MPFPEHPHTARPNAPRTSFVPAPGNYFELCGVVFYGDDMVAIDAHTSLPVEAQQYRTQKSQ